MKNIIIRGKSTGNKNAKSSIKTSTKKKLIKNTVTKGTKINKTAAKQNKNKLNTKKNKIVKSNHVLKNSKKIPKKSILLC